MNQPQFDAIEIETSPNPGHAVIWLHGLGADANDFVPLVPELGLKNHPPIRFVFPNAPVQPVTINGGMPMRAWYDILNADLVRREDEQGILDSERLIQALIKRENDRGIPTEKIVLAGFSQGCAMTLHTGTRLGQKLAGLVGLSGYLPLADLFAAQRHSANQDTPIFMAHGTQDPVVTLDRAQASCELLQKLGYQVTFKTYTMPHSVCLPEISDIADFLRKVLL
ncbi:alpha/beta hydrolase [Eoetvoesiella caeni]|uniref:Phospholipase/carboxylesterase n=1 Tax=Eoetvoesiella caeni TaxID=645616 RepID=A0A366HE24_9BURK|nr:dienelactone hydrolase family protein [Eoetvoesiella caeni]MCI2809022.1 alpha/beta hydrolase [Eoetvoesiella caeni]NYT55477.1 dienelactone hydrolase family protein [Eoetvoesiella caeni]RBP40032.1 phospholipase/carboxylesterase [Eoetvoesiella caeni]